MCLADIDNACRSTSIAPSCYRYLAMGSFSAGADRLLPAMGILRAVQVHAFARAPFRDCLPRLPSTHLFFNHKQPLSTTLAAANPSPQSNLTLALLGAHQSHHLQDSRQELRLLEAQAMHSFPTSSPLPPLPERGSTPRSPWPIPPELGCGQHGSQAPSPLPGPWQHWHAQLRVSTSKTCCTEERRGPDAHHPCMLPIRRKSGASIRPLRKGVW